MSHHDHHNAHTGPISTPKQFAWTVFLSFFVPVAIVIGLVYYVIAQVLPSSSSDAQTLVLAGTNTEAISKATATRIQKVGTVEIKDANRALASGEAVYKAQCVACHGAGVAGAPKFGDAAGWGARIKTGYESLLTAALKGKGAMGAQGGGEFDDVEIGRAVVYMANSAGGNFPVPDRKAAPAAAAASASGK